MKRFLGIGALVLALALIVPAAILAFSSTQDEGQRASVSAAENDGATDSTSTEDSSDPKPWVGLYVMEVTERLSERLDIDAEDGVAVVKVVDDGPADDAGIERGDIIVSVGDSDISTVSDVRDAVGAASVGDAVTVTIERDGSESSYDVTVGERPSSNRGGGSKHSGKSGIMGASGVGAVIASLNADLAEKLEIDTEEGVVIVKVTADGPADDAGLHSGDIVVSVDGETVESVSDVVTAVRDAEAGDTLTFVVDREGESSNLTLNVTVEEGYGLRGASLNLLGFGGIRGVLSGDEEGPIDITVSKVAVKEIGENSVTLTPTEEGNDDITASVTEDSGIFKDGERAALSDLVVDDEGYAVVIDGELSVLFIGTIDNMGRGHGRFGRFGGDGDFGGAGAFRRGGRGFGGGALTLPPGFFGGRDFLSPPGDLDGTPEQSQGETIT